jgi:NAD(P)-dependent dehydrogenase (short-subunit alcohol dehydrogenase family)
MPKPLDGKVCLVTGAATGIGRATAEAFVDAGAQVVVADVVETTIAGCTFVRTDVRRADEVQALIDAVVAQHGRLDCAFNNAGVEGVMAPMADYPDDVFERVVDVNLRGVWLCMRAELRQMRAQGGGAIVNASSAAGLVGASTFSAYAATKHAVVGLTKTAALDHARDGIRVNAVCPGGVDTPMLARIAASVGTTADAMLRPGTVGRIGQPNEVANAVVWLCSDAASFVTGHALAVDGGLVAQ